MSNLAVKLNPEALRPPVSFPKKTGAPEEKKPFTAKIIRLDERRKMPIPPEVVSGCCCCCAGPVPVGL